MSVAASELQRPEARWPRVYPLRRGLRRLLAGLGASLAAAGGVVALCAALPRAPGARLVMELLGVLLVGAGAFFAWLPGTTRLVLSEDAVELVDLAQGRRRVHRDEIVGRRLVPLRWGLERLVLELRWPGERPVAILWAFEPDAVLAAWLEAIPDLGADRRAEELRRWRRLRSSALESRRASARARAP